MDNPAAYFHWGFILISAPNAALILGMIALFLLALLLPFPAHRSGPRSEDDPGDE